MIQGDKGKDQINMMAPRSGVRGSRRKYEVKYKKYQEGKDEIELKYMNLIHAEIIKNK
jgi:hypothetical protein